MTLLIKLDQSKPDKKQIRVAANIIKNGGIVVFPTETVYGIGANALDKTASKMIFKVKGRPSDNPIIVHVSSIEMAQTIADIPENQIKAMKKIWPAPLTIIVRAKNSLPKVVTGGLDTVAIRMPKNKIAFELIKESGVPIAAPSANISKRPSSTNFLHAKKYFNKKVDMIIDGGKSKFGLESTVIDLRNLEILRPGVFTPAQITKIFRKKPKVIRNFNYEKVRSPGLKYTHYSPKTRLLLFTGEIKKLPEIAENLKNYTFIGSNKSCNYMAKFANQTMKLGKRNNLGQIASNLFDVLIKLDLKNTKTAIIENFPEKDMGLAIMNRIRKASGGKSFKNKRELDQLLRANK